MGKQRHISITLLVVILSLVSLTHPHGRAAAVAVRIAYPTLGAGVAPIWITKEAGFFKQEGLEVELVYIQGGTTVVQAMVGGDVPVAYVNADTAVTSRLGGADVRIVLQASNLIDGLFVTARGITNPQQLRGQKVAVNRIGDISYFAAQFALRQLGLNPERDVTMLQIGGTPDRFAALKAGSIQGAVMNYMMARQAKGLGFNILANIQMDYPYNAIATTGRFIQQREEIVQRIVRAFVRGVHYFKTNRPESNRIVARYLRTSDLAMIDDAYEYYAFTLYQARPYPTEQGFAQLLQVLAERYPKAKGASMDQFYDFRFIRAIEQEGLLKRLYGEK